MSRRKPAVVQTDLMIVTERKADLAALRRKVPEWVECRLLATVAERPDDTCDVVYLMARTSELPEVRAAWARLKEAGVDAHVMWLTDWGDDEPFSRWLIAPARANREPDEHFLLWLAKQSRTDPDEPKRPPAAPWGPLRLRELPEAPAFPIDVLPAALRGYAAELAAATQAPLDLAGGVMLGAASAAIGQSFHLALKRSWSESPLLYLMLVVKPGGKKTPMLRLGLKPLSAIDARLRRQSREALEDWTAARTAAARDALAPPPGPEPPQLRAVVRDITRESLCGMMQDNPRGLLCDPDEATAWVASFNEYKAKGADRQFWISNYSGSPVSVDRKGGQKSIHVPFPGVTVVAGIQPEMLSALLEERGRDDGFLDRILFVMPDRAAWPPQRWDDCAVSEPAEAAWAGTIERLHAEPMLDEPQTDTLRPRLVGFTEAGARAWQAWYDVLGAAIDEPDRPDRETGLLSKFVGTSARLALILSRLRLAVEPGNDLGAPVDACDVQAAARLVRYFEGMRARVSHTMSGGMGSPAAARIVAWLRRKHLACFTRSDLRSDLRRTLTDDELDEGLKHLLNCCAIRGVDEPPAPPRTGRRPSEAYEVHPVLLAARTSSRECPDSHKGTAAGSKNGFSVNTGASQEPGGRRSA